MLQLFRGNRLHLCFHPGYIECLLGEFEPRTLPGVGQVKQTYCVVLDQLFSLPRRSAVNVGDNTWSVTTRTAPSLRALLIMSSGNVQPLRLVAVPYNPAERTTR